MRCDCDSIIARVTSKNLLTCRKSRGSTSLSRPLRNTGALDRHRDAGDDQVDAVDARGDALVDRACQIPEGARQRIVRDDAEPDLVGDEDDAPLRCRQPIEQRAATAGSESAPPSSRLLAQSVRQSTRMTPPVRSCTAIAAARSVRTSTVRQRPSRSARWRAMRARISSSNASAVAMKVIASPVASATACACRLLPERAPPITSRVDFGRHGDFPGGWKIASDADAGG